MTAEDTKENKGRKRCGSFRITKQENKRPKETQGERKTSKKLRRAALPEAAYLRSLLRKKRIKQCHEKQPLRRIQTQRKEKKELS